MNPETEITRRSFVKRTTGTVLLFGAAITVGSVVEGSVSEGSCAPLSPCNKGWVLPNYPNQDPTYRSKCDAAGANNATCYYWGRKSCSGAIAPTPGGDVPNTSPTEYCYWGS